VWDVCPPAQSVQAGQAVEIAAIHMQDLKNGWANDNQGHILYTVDGGITWQNVTPPQGRYEAVGFFPLDALTAWAAPAENCTCTETACPPSVSHGLVWLTIDGGKTWQQGQPFPLELEGWKEMVPYFAPISLKFIDENIGWLLVAVGNLADNHWMELFRSTNGGETWARIADHSTSLSMPVAQEIAFLDIQTGWLAADTSALADTVGIPLSDARKDPQNLLGVLKTTNGGFYWDLQSLPVPQGVGKILDNDPNAEGELKCGVSRVQTWPPDQVSVQTACYLSGASYNRWYNDEYYSFDGGQTWKDWTDTINVEFVNANLGWSLIDEQNGLYYLIRMGQGWQSWDYIRELAWQGELNFVDSQHGWVVANKDIENALVYTTNGGHTWQVSKPVIGP
jgi:photosystem II stability/assembly factor-like uncharacterized protein